MTIVAEQYSFVVGVDTHAASHTFAVVAAVRRLSRERRVGHAARLDHDEAAVGGQPARVAPRERREAALHYVQQIFEMPSPRFVLYDTWIFLRHCTISLIGNQCAAMSRRKH